MTTVKTQTPKRAYDRESNVLIVDDDSTLLKFFKIHLNKFFSRVVVVENGKAALDAMKERDMDLVLTDVRMPKIDGLELLQRLRKSYAEIPVLLISGEPMSAEQEKLVNTADGFLSKPFGVDELNDFISKGIDLRMAMKELSPHLKDPKKIRAAMTAQPAALEKMLKKGGYEQAKESQRKIQELLKVGA